MPEFLSLDAQGRLSPDGEAARRYLAGREGRWRVVPTSEDLFLLRREQASAAPEGVRAVLVGDLRGVGLGELVSFLAQSRWTGVLTVISDGVEKTIFLSQGALRWATSNLPTDRLGEAVRRLGLVDGDRLEAALASHAPGTKVGQVLVSSGLITVADLYKAVRHQIEEIFFSVLVLDRGVYLLFNDPVEDRFGAQVSLELFGLLMDGLRRIDELGHFRKVIPGPEAFVARRDRTPEGLSHLEQSVWDAVDGRRTVREVALEAHLSEFDATKALFGLTEAGFLEVTEARRAVVLGRATDQLKPEIHEIVRVFNAIFREIIDEVGRMAPTIGFRLGVDGFFESGHHGYPDVLEGVSLDLDGLVPEGRLVKNLSTLDPGKVPDPARRLFEALNEVMFFELFQAGEMLPQDRDEDLSRRVKRIYALLER